MIETSVMEIINRNSDTPVCPEHVDRCHPIGRPRDGKQHVLLKFVSYRYRRQLMMNKKRLREGGVVVVEDLTRMRYRLLKSAKVALGSKDVWTSDVGSGWSGSNIKPRFERIRDDFNFGIHPAPKS